MTEQLIDEFDFDEEFDPLEVNDEEINPDEIDEDNPYDTADYPVMRNDPEELMDKNAIFTPERAGSAQAAMLDLIDHNMGRKPVLLTIIDLCRGDGCKTSVIKEKVAEAQRFNKSVFAPVTFCRMLERAGGLTLEVPEPTEEHEVVEDGVVYLEIKEDIDPIWTSTDAALEVYDQFVSGDPFRDIVYDRDSKYYDVYLAVLERFDEAPRTMADIEEFCNGFEICYQPRRFGGHFIDMLERTDAIVWRDDIWNITDLGRRFMQEMQTAKAEGRRMTYGKTAEAEQAAKEAETEEKEA